MAFVREYGWASNVCPAVTLFMLAAMTRSRINGAFLKSLMRKKLLTRFSPAIVFILMLAIITGCAGTTTPKGWSGVAISSGDLFVGSMDGRIIGLNATDRSRLWNDIPITTTTSGGAGCAPATTGLAIYSTPVVSNGLVYVAGYNGKIYAITVDRGTIRWTYPPETNLQPLIGGITIVDNRLYFASSSGRVYALAADTGDPLWGTPFQSGSKIWATPLIVGDTLYIGSFDKKMYAVDSSNGQTKWSFETEGAIISTPALQDNTLYFGSFDRFFYAIDAVSGTLKWKTPGTAGSWFWADPVFANGNIYAPNLDGKLYIFNAADGSEVVPPIDLESSVASSPVLVGNNLVVANQNGKVWAIDVTQSSKRLLHDFQKTINSSLSVEGDIVYIHVPDEIDALNVSTGVIAWTLPLAAQ